MHVKKGNLANHLTIMNRSRETARAFNELASIGSSGDNRRLLSNHGNLIGYTVYQYIWANGKGKCKSTNDIFSHLIGCFKSKLLVLIQKVLIFLSQKSILFQMLFAFLRCLLGKTSPREFSHFDFLYRYVGVQRFQSNGKIQFDK